MKKRQLLLLLGCCVCAAGLFAQPPIPGETMQKVYEEVKTPYKYGLVLVPDDNSRKMDCPTVFRKGRSWYMTYLVFDGRGYETWLAKSKDLLEWKTLGKVLSYGEPTQWDGNQRGGYPALQDNRWGGNYRLKKHDGKYWMTYIGGAAAGYEAGNLAIGAAYTSNDIRKPHEWTRLPRPVLSSDDTGKRWWEKTKLFKSSVIADPQKTTGYPYVMYYNAVGDTAENNVKTRWYERIGMAVSDDMKQWKRFGEEPVMHHPVGITGDAVVQKMDSLWVMFSFGAFWQDRKGAFNRFACSRDLVHWTDWEGDNLVEPSEPYDALYAHKSYVIKYKGVVYHFYCAVNKQEQRGIAVATSKDKGKSKLNFK